MAAGLARRPAARPHHHARDRRRLPRPAVAAVVLAVLSLVTGLAAPARATTSKPRLTSSTPANGAVLSASPKSVKLVFDHWPDSDTRVTVTGPQGVVASGKPKLWFSSAELTLPANLPGGSYRADWTASFGLTELPGSLTFTVGTPAPTVAPVPTPRPAPVTTAAPPATTSRPPATSRPASKTTTGDARPTDRPSVAPTAMAMAPAVATTATGTVPGTGPVTSAGTTTTDDTALAAQDNGSLMPPPLVWLALLVAAAGLFGTLRWRRKRRVSGGDGAAR